MDILISFVVGAVFFIGVIILFYKLFLRNLKKKILAERKEQGDTNTVITKEDIYQYRKANGTVKERPADKWEDID